MPAYVWAGVSLITRIQSRLRRRDPAGAACYSGLLAAVYLVAAGMDGYSFVMAAVTTALLSACASLASPKRPRIAVLAGLLLGFMAIGAGGICYAAIVFQGVDRFNSPMDFYRGASIDLVTVVVPTARTWVADVLGVGVDRWNAHAFFGNGKNVAYNFLGPATLAVPLVGLIVAVRRATERPAPGRAHVVGLALVIAFGFVVSLGPSLKINSTREAQPGEQPRFQSYLMPAEAALAPMPTAFVFRMPVVRAMRAVSRWQFMTRLGLAMATAIGIGLAWGRLRWWTLALAALLIAESLSTDVVDRGRPFHRSHDDMLAFAETALPEFRAVLHPAERVLFLPAENDYLIYTIMADATAFAYNVGQDKARSAARRRQPDLVKEVMRKYGAGTMTWSDLGRLFREDLVDQVVLMRMSLRWDSYRWPPREDRVRQLSRRIDALGAPPAALVAEDYRHFTTIRRRDPGPPPRDAGIGVSGSSGGDMEPN
jgi:hypothetical protein